MQTPKTITISNEGELELNAIQLMGASTKRDDDSKIGMFGTGFKYAIAVLMRKGYAIEILSGKTRIRFETKDAALGGQTFSQVHMRVNAPRTRVRGVPLSFTTEMGLQWTIDNAMREIICNARDAGNLEVSVGNPPPKGLPGATHVCITSTNPARTKGAAEEHIENFDQFYLFNRVPIFKDSHISIYENKDTFAHVFRNGVRVFTDPQLKSAYDYEVETPIDERRVASLHNCLFYIGTNLGRLAKEHIFRILKASGDEGYIEKGLSYFSGGLSGVAAPPDKHVYCTKELAADWVAGKFGRALEGFVPFVVNRDVYSYFKDHEHSRTVHSVIGGKADGLIEVPLDKLTDIERLTLNTALDFCAAAGYPLPPDLLKIYHDDDDTQFGLYSHGHIWLKQFGLNRGAFEVVHTLLHEVMHHRSGQSDETRGFEDFIIRELVSALQHKVGRAL